jgi:pyrroline-5-carboxylate reductase
MRLGFIGTGNIAAAMIIGLSTRDAPPPAIVVSPRNAAKAAALAARFANIHVAPDNQAALDACDLVVLAVRPQIAHEVLSALRFRADHAILSLIAILPRAQLAPLVAPARRIVRAVPVPSVARRIGPIAMTPRDGEMEALLSGIGTPVATDDEHRFETLWTLTALIAPYYKLVDRAALWASAQGLPAEDARRYAATLFHALSLPLAEPGADPAELAQEAQTVGGLNEQVVRELEQADVYGIVAQRLHRILARLEGTPVRDPRDGS